MTRKFHLVALIAAATILCAIVFDMGSAIAAEIKLLATANAAMRNALTELAPGFERSTGHKVTMDFAPAIPLKRWMPARHSTS